MADRRQLIRSLCRKGVLYEGPLTFDGVMRGGVALGHFKKFCLQDLSTEPLLFWLEAHEYAGIKSADFVGATARRLLSKYIAPDAPMAVAISDRLRLEATEAVEGGRASASTFDAVLQSVDNSLRYDVFPRFCQSDWCAQLVAMQVEASTVIGVGDFDLCRFLGAGGFGMVLLCRRRDTKKYYALKVIDKQKGVEQCSGCGGRGAKIQTIRMGPMIQQVQKTCDDCGGRGTIYRQVNGGECAPLRATQ